MSDLQILGRSSSHFTRTVRIFAAELSVPYRFVAMADLLSRDPTDYADNPALRLPILVTPEGPWFGALNICRELARRAPHPAHVLWPEDVQPRLAANAQELVLQGMSTAVTLIMSRLARPDAPGAYDEKNREALTNILAWLEAELPAVSALLDTDHALRFFDVTLFCFLGHVTFRQLADLTGHVQLTRFCAQFAQRAAARATEYCFDPPAQAR